MPIKRTIKVDGDSSSAGLRMRNNRAMMGPIQRREREIPHFARDDMGFPGIYEERIGDSQKNIE